MRKLLLYLLAAISVGHMQGRAQSQALQEFSKVEMAVEKLVCSFPDSTGKWEDAFVVQFHVSGSTWAIDSVSLLGPWPKGCSMRNFESNVRSRIKQKPVAWRLLIPHASAKRASWIFQLPVLVYAKNSQAPVAAGSSLFQLYEAKVITPDMYFTPNVVMLPPTILQYNPTDPNRML